MTAVAIDSGMRPGPSRHVIEGTVIGTVLTALSYYVGIKMGWVAKLDWLEVFAVFTSYVCTWLCVRERRINYPIGAASTAAYCVLFVKADLLASAILNAYLTPSLLYGWIRWKKDVTTRPVEHIKLRWIPVYAAVTAAAYFGASALVKALGGGLVWTDTVILCGSILAQFMLDNKKLENWVVWLVVNGFAIYTYATAGLALAAFQYVFFALNAFVGFFIWGRSMRNGKRIRTNDSIAPDERALALGAVR